MNDNKWSPYVKKNIQITFRYLDSKEQLLTTYYLIIQAWYLQINLLDETVKTA